MRQSPRSRQHGVVLFIALIVLVAMSLAGVALIRGVDTGTLIASNLAFRQNAMHVADLGVEAARGWLLTNGGPSLYGNQPAVTGGAGYWATAQDTIDLLNNDPGKVDYDWTSATTVTAAPFTPPAGYSVRYVIHRLCASTGDPASVNCAKTTGTAGSVASGSKGAAAYGSFAISAPTNAFYRITVQVTGPRNALSFVQTTVF